MKNRKIQLLVLTAALIIILGGGIWLFTTSGKPDAPVAESPSAQTSSVADSLSDERLQFELAVEEQQPITDYMPYLGEIYLYHGEPARLRYATDDEVLFELVSLSDGSVLQEYPWDYFTAGEFFSSVYLDGAGQLWILWYNSETNENYIGRAAQGQTEEDLVSLGENPFQYTCDRFSVFEEYAVLFGLEEAGSYCLVLYHTEQGSSVQWTDISDFWLDDQTGYLYFIESGALTKYELATGRILWKQTLSGNRSYHKLWYQPEEGLFCLCAQEGSILCCDIETGESTYELFNMVQDSALSYPDMASASFAVDGDGSVWFLRVDMNDLDSNNLSYDMTVWQYVPYIPDVDESEIVSLTITAPYPVDSIDASIRMYQKDHPEVTIEWDTQYASRDDFLDHADQYAEQITLRTMTGDVGDIQMISGTGMDLDAILDTDVMTDLSEYLKNDPSLDELAPNLLAPLYDNQGSIRALPLGIRPVYMIYNKSLADELGITLDPQTVKWSEILELALKWQEEGRPESIFVMDSSVGVDSLMSHILRFLNSFNETAEKISHNAISSLYRFVFQYYTRKRLRNFGKYAERLTVLSFF